MYFTGKLHNQKKKISVDAVRDKYLIHVSLPDPPPPVSLFTTFNLDFTTRKKLYPVPKSANTDLDVKNPVNQMTRLAFTRICIFYSLFQRSESLGEPPAPPLQHTKINFRLQINFLTVETK